MTKTEIKHNIHSLIDTVEDTNKLEEIQEFVDFIINTRTIEWESLSESERRSVEEGLEDVKAGKTISYEQFKKKHSKWFEK
jgi:hypothetical protein